MADIKKGARITGARRDKLAATVTKKYDGGASIRELAESTGRSYGFVHRLLSESGATMRGRGGATRGRDVKGAPRKISTVTAVKDGPTTKTTTSATGTSARSSAAKKTGSRAKLHSVK